MSALDGPDQSDADPVAVLLGWLKAHPTVAALLGGADHVSGIKETPWPHLVIRDGAGGDLRDFRWDAELEVVFDLYGHPNGAPGASALRRLMYKVLRAAAQLPDEQAIDAYTPVVSRVRPSGRDIDQTAADGQPLLSSGVLVTIRPPRALPPTP